MASSDGWIIPSCGFIGDLLRLSLNVVDNWGVKPMPDDTADTHCMGTARVSVRFVDDPDAFCNVNHSPRCATKSNVHRN